MHISWLKIHDFFLKENECESIEFLIVFGKIYWFIYDYKSLKKNDKKYNLKKIYSEYNLWVLDFGENWPKKNSKKSLIAKTILKSK